MTKEGIIRRIEQDEQYPLDDKRLIAALVKELDKDSLGIGGCFNINALPARQQKCQTIEITEMPKFAFVSSAWIEDDEERAD